MNKNQCETNCENLQTNRVSTENSVVNTCECESTTSNEDSCCCSSDPINAAKKLLESSFLTAMKEVHVEKLKKIIEKEWGSTIDKSVELTINTISKQWQASLSKTSANKEFYNELEKIFKNNNQK
ncbi:MAG: hypothetical protein ACE5SW_08540 [Nitrososphaeraceae archaeon]